jgi:hypothetical protein
MRSDLSDPISYLISHELGALILIAMTQPPDRYSCAHGFPLGFYQGLELQSPVEDELCIQMILNALDRVYDRCEETVELTGQPILCWLRSHHRNQAYRLPFQLVSKSASRLRYRRLSKRFCTFLLRFRRLGPAAGKAVMKRTLEPHQQYLVDQVWACALQSLQSNATQTGSGRESLCQTRSTITNLPELVSADDSEDNVDDSASEWSDNDVQSLDGSLEDAAFTNIRGDEDEITSHSALLYKGFETVDVLAELVFQLMTSFCLEEFKDGQPSSSLLVYFSGILGFTLDGTTFRRARDYTPYLSALIHQQQLLCLEYALPITRVYPSRAASKTSAQSTSAPQQDPLSIYVP